MQVFVNRNGRTIDLASCLVQGCSIMVIVSPLKRTAIKDRLEQYIFFGDKVTTGAQVLPVCICATLIVNVSLGVSSK